MNRQIILNQIVTPDGTRLMSLHRHDYVSYIDTNGHMYVVDGGRDYLKRTGPRDYHEITVYSDEPFYIIRYCLYRGTYGKDGTSKLQWVLLKDMELSHIQNIIVNVKSISSYYKSLLMQELMWRGQFKCQKNLK